MTKRDPLSLDVVALAICSFEQDRPLHTLCTGRTEPGLIFSVHPRRGYSREAVIAAVVFCDASVGSIAAARVGSSVVQPSS